jgi:hypothetical protein
MLKMVVKSEFWPAAQKSQFLTWMAAAILKIRDFLTFDTKGLEIGVIPQFWLLCAH